MLTNEEMFKQLDDYIVSKGSNESELIAILHKAQDIFGYLPMIVQKHIAAKLNINVSKVLGVVTFYSYFSMEPKGQYVVSVCLGTACFVKGSPLILEQIEKVLGIKNGQTTSDNKFTITTLRCVGECALAPVIQINGKTYGNVKTDDIERILAEYM